MWEEDDGDSWTFTSCWRHEAMTTHHQEDTSTDKKNEPHPLIQEFWDFREAEKGQRILTTTSLKQKQSSEKHQWIIRALRRDNVHVLNG